MPANLTKKKGGVSVSRRSALALALVALVLAVCAVPQAAVADDEETIPVYRLYNSYTGEHHFTKDENEYSTLVSLGWTDEGVAWYAPEESETPVYRLYNPYTGDHHYTTDANEYATLAALGWTQEGIAFYSADEDEGTPVYRLYNPYASAFYHHYTTDATEYDTLETLGWEQEGIGWYGIEVEDDATEDSSGSSGSSGTTSSDDDIVYTTEYGTKYHLDSCPTIANSTSITERTRAEAESLGYEACKVCEP